MTGKPGERAKAPTRYQVTGALAIVQAPGPNGLTPTYVYKGGVVPDGVPQANLDHLVAGGLIAAIQEAVST